MPVHQSQHPITKVLITKLRDKEATAANVRDYLGRLSVIVGLEATGSLPVQDVQGQTPFAPFTGSELGIRVALAPILRSGIQMEAGLLSLLPDAPVYHLGLFRDPKSLRPTEYYSKLPQNVTVDTVFILDPLLATGGTALAAISMTEQWGLRPRDIKVVGILGSKVAVEAIDKVYPEVEIFVAALDNQLSDKGYVLPGVGDIGNRIYRT